MFIWHIILMNQDPAVLLSCQAPPAYVYWTSSAARAIKQFIQSGHSHHEALVVGNIHGWSGGCWQVFFPNNLQQKQTQKSRLLTRAARWARPHLHLSVQVLLHSCKGISCAKGKLAVGCCPTGRLRWPVRLLPCAMTLCQGCPATYCDAVERPSARHRPQVVHKVLRQPPAVNPA